MTHAEAKFVLVAYRPGGQDAGDAKFAEAVGQAGQDPQLAAWFARSRGYDAAMAAALGEVAPPAGLRASILAGARASERPRAGWRRPAWLALAAGFAAFLTVATLWYEDRGESAVRAFAQFAVDDTVAGNHVGEGGPKAALAKWLETSGTRLASAPLPVDFQRLRTTGCRTVRFAGHDVLEVCFGRHGSMFHLYVMRRGDAPELPSRESPEMVARAGATAAVWSDTRYDYAVATDKGEDALKQVL